MSGGHVHNPEPSGLALRSMLPSHAPQWPCFRDPTEGLGREQLCPDGKGLRGPRSPCQRRRIPAVCRISPQRQWTGLCCLGASSSSAERNPWLNGVSPPQGPRLHGTQGNFKCSQQDPVLGTLGISGCPASGGLLLPPWPCVRWVPNSGPEERQSPQQHPTDLQIEPGAEDTWKVV